MSVWYMSLHRIPLPKCVHVITGLHLLRDDGGWPAFIVVEPYSVLSNVRFYYTVIERTGEEIRTTQDKGAETISFERVLCLMYRSSAIVVPLILSLHDSQLFTLLRGEPESS